MTAFFSQRPGTVVRVAGTQQAMPLRIMMAGTTFGGGASNVIVTRASITEQGSAQFLHTLADTIYAYVFSDRIGELQLSGLMFASSCHSPGVTGLEQLREAYANNRVAARGAPVLVNVGNLTYRSFLMRMSADTGDPEQMVGQWSLYFKTVAGNR